MNNKILFLTWMSVMLLGSVACKEVDSSHGLEQSQRSAEHEKKEDCDKTAAEKTLEKIKKEEFSLLKKENDPGCSLEEKKVELPSAK